MSYPARSIMGADDVQARNLQQFPDTFDLKLELNFAAFCQPSLACGHFRRCTLTSRRLAL
jgi:hypothetical protein